MGFSLGQKEQHFKYANAPAEIKETVDAAFDAVVTVFKSAGLNTNMADPAEELVAAVYRYFERSSAKFVA